MTAHKTLSFRMPSDLHDRLQARAAAKGLPLAAYMRTVLLADAPPPDAEKPAAPAQPATTQPQAQAPAPQPPRKYFAPNGRGGVTEAQTEVQTLLRQMFAMGATRADMLEAVLQGQTDQTVISFAGSAVDAFLRTQDTLEHLFDDEDPPPYDETVGLKLTTDE